MSNIGNPHGDVPPSSRADGALDVALHGARRDLDVG